MKQLFIILLLFASFYCLSQEKKEEGDSEIEQIDPETGVYNFAEVFPEYPGGVSALRKEVGTKYQIPSDYEGEGGTLVLRFVVSKTGSVKKVSVLKGIEGCSQCSEEGIRVMTHLSQPFTPALQDGKEVEVYFTMPIVIKMNTKKKKKRKKKD